MTEAGSVAIKIRTSPDASDSSRLRAFSTGSGQRSPVASSSVSVMGADYSGGACRLLWRRETGDCILRDINPQHVAGCVIAGGLSRRMGEDKAFLRLGDETLVARAVRRLGAQTAILAVNSNGDPTLLADLGQPVLADVITGHPGPLAGVLTAMQWAGAQGQEWVVTAAIDTPFFPDDLVARLVAAARGHDLAVAASGGKRHPLFALWPVRLAEDIRHALTDEDERRVNAMIDRYRTGLAEWDTSPFDRFFNINNPEDLAAARRIMTEYDA